MHAIARGAGHGVRYEDILAINLRMEIMFGLFNDGCTSLGWKTADKSIIAQNWDWMTEQRDNVIILNVAQPGKPRFSIGVEAGIIGKIGLNSAGIGLVANGIRAKGVDYTRTPVHICMRLILESTTRAAAIAAVEKYGCAVSTHIMVGDRTGAVSLECTTRDIVKLQMDPKGRIFHTNHLLGNHPGVTDTMWLKDSVPRVKRLKELADQLGSNPSETQIADLFKDDQNYPHGICRVQCAQCDGETLYNVVMDLDKRTAVFKLGRPSEPREILTLRP